MADRAEFDMLLRLRGYRRRDFMKLRSEIQNHIASFLCELQEYDYYLQRLFKIQSELDKLNDEIVALYIKFNISDEVIDTRISEFDQYDAYILELRTLLRSAKTFTLGETAVMNCAFGEP